MPRSQNNEVAGGLTHWAIITHDDIIAGYDGTAVVLSEAIGIPKGAIVEDVLLHVIEPFAPVTSTFVGEAGDGTDPNGWVLSIDPKSAAGTTKINTGAYANDGTTDNVVNGKLYSSKDTIDFTLTALSAAEILSMSAGKILVGANIIDPSSYV